MVKPVFKALTAFRSAANADEAATIAVNFLSSPDARTVNDAQAGTFFKDIEASFKQFAAPKQYERVLLAALSGETSHASAALQQAASFKHMDFTDAVRHAGEDQKMALQNAKIFAAVNASQAHSKDGIFIEHQGGGDPTYPGISAARSPAFLKESLNSMLLLEPDVADEYAEGFMRTLMVAFRRTKATPHEQVEMLSMIADSTSEQDKLHDLVVARAVQITDVTQGPRPNSAFSRGLDLNRE